MSENGNGNGTNVKPWQWTGETAPTQGRTPGARNKFGLAFIEAIRRQFDEGGEEALRILRIEDPGAFLKVCASVIPHELHLVPAERHTVRWMSDDDDDDAVPVIQKYE
jgi:hypothetical protein